MKIHIRLSPESIQQAREDLNAYREKLNAKLEEYLDELAKIGINVIKVNVAQAVGADDRNVNIDTEITRNGSKTSMRITVTGKDLLFIEYGAGIRFNNGNIHPFAHQFGYGVGTYPGQTHALDPNGWYYRKPKGKGGKLYHSYGTEATMPVYKAWLSIQENAAEVAKRVFV